MPNNNAPFGDIYAVQTPSIDRAANVLYQRKQQEDARGYQDYVNTQALLQKEIGNVRSADVEDYINKYQQYKNLRQQMLFDRKIKNNPKLYAQKNREATEALNDALMFASASKQLKEQDAKLSQDIYTRPNNYLDEAHGVLQKNLSLPLSKRQDNYETYSYNGANKDIQPLLQKAVGTPTAIFVDEGDSKGGLQSQQRKFMVGNSPQQMYDIIYGSLTDRNYAKALSQLASQTTPEDLAAIDNQYDQVMKSLPKSLSNKVGVEIKINPNNPLSVEAAYLAKKLAIDKYSKIGEGELIKKTNSKETIDYRHEQAMKSIAANKGNGYSSNGSNPNADNSTEFDRMGNIEPLVFPKSGVVLKSGEARDKNGNLFNGDLVTTGDRIGSGLKTVLKSGGFDFTDSDKSDYFTFRIKDGRIEAMKPNGGSWIDRQDLINFQLKANSEPQKGQQPRYGNPVQGSKKQQQQPVKTGNTGFKLPQNFHP